MIRSFESGTTPLYRLSSISPVQLRDQRGAILVVSLVLLVVLTFLAVTALNTSNLEEKMANNTQEAHRAFQTAESGIADTFADSTMFDLTVLAPDPASPVALISKWAAEKLVML